MFTKQETEFVIKNREIITQMAKKYLDDLKNVIWKEKVPEKKAEHSAVADRVEDFIIQVKNLKFPTSKEEGKYTGL